jgi:hypothetical protein
MSKIHVAAIVSSLLLSTAPAFAASDYLLQLDPVKGQGQDAAAPQSIQVESFSWGASNPGVAASSAAAAAGKVNVQDISMTRSKAPRDAATGMASGKRVATEVAADGQLATAGVPPRVGDVAVFTVMIRESPSKPADQAGACATGVHFPHAVIVARGERYEFTDLVETSCTVVDGKTRKDFTGHVTLIK